MDIEVDSTTCIFYMISFLIASEGLAIVSLNPHLHIVKVNEDPVTMYAQLAYNISIIFLLQLGLNKMSKLFCVKNTKLRKFRSSLFVDIAIIIGLDCYFSDQPLNMKSAIYTIFLSMLYLKAICPYLNGSLQKILFIIAEGVVYSLILMLAFKIELIKSYDITGGSADSNANNGNVKNDHRCSSVDSFKNPLCL